MYTKWAPIISHAREIVGLYDTGVTLRQLFYRLVADGTLENTQTRYNQLSRKTAEARRCGKFPDLIDRTRTIHEYQSWSSPHDAVTSLARTYRRDRTEGQPYSLYLGVEKAGIVAQLELWFGELGIPIVSFHGYASQSYVFEVIQHVKRQGRSGVMIYAGDFDPSGKDIPEDFAHRSNCWEKFHRIALSWKQIERYNLPPMMGKPNDPRAKGFVRRHGELVQVELDALPPDTLRSLYQRGIDHYWDSDVYETAMAREREDRRALQRVKV